MIVEGRAGAGPGLPTLLPRGNRGSWRRMMMEANRKRIYIDWRWWLTAIGVSAVAAAAGFAAGMWLGR